MLKRDFMDKLSYKTLNEGFLDFEQSHNFIEYLGNEITITSNKTESRKSIRGTGY